MISEVIEQQEIKITKQRAEIERHAGEVKALHETIGVIDRQHAAEIRRLQTPRFDVVQLQPDDDCPGLWIGFQTAADREEAMKLFRCVQSPPAVICPFCKQRVSETCCNEQNHKDCICWIEVQPLSVDPKSPTDSIDAAAQAIAYRLGYVWGSSGLDHDMLREAASAALDAASANPKSPTHLDPKS